MTDAVLRQQEKVAKLRALCGRKDAALKDVLDNTPPGTPAHDAAKQGLAAQLEDAA